MIEVLRGPRKPRVECPECGAILKYDKEDIRIRSHYDERILFIYCPCCNTTIELKEEQNEKK